MRQDSREGELKLRLKRLLVTDRRLGRRQKGGDQRFAFYSAAAPGSGVEVRFSGYEAFALLAAVAMLEHGFPQARVVRALTEVRNQLEHAHAEILAKDPHELFDENTINARAKSGTLATGSTDEVFLVIATFPSLAQQKTAVRICRGQAEYMDFLLRQSPTGTHFDRHSFQSSDASPGGEYFAGATCKARTGGKSLTMPRAPEAEVDRQNGGRGRRS